MWAWWCQGGWGGWLLMSLTMIVFVALVVGAAIVIVRAGVGLGEPTDTRGRGEKDEPWLPPKT